MILGIFGFFIGIVGFSVIVDGHFLRGVFLILTGALIAPVSFAQIANKINIVNKPVTQWTLVVLTFVISLAMPGPKGSAEQLASPLSTEPAVPQRPDTEILAELESQAATVDEYTEMLRIRDEAKGVVDRNTQGELNTRAQAIIAKLEPQIAQKLAQFEKEKAAEQAKLEKEAAAFRTKVKNEFKLDREEIRDARFYTHKRFNGLKNFVGGYIASGLEKGSIPVLRFKAMYYGDDWLFVEALRFKCGEESYYFQFPYFGDKGFKRDNSGGSVWEYVDTIPTGEQLLLMRCAADTSNRVLYSFEGKQYRKDVTMSKADQQALAATLKLYDNYTTYGF